MNRVDESTPATSEVAADRRVAESARRRGARLAAAALAAVTAVLYALVAAGAVTVLDGPADEVAATQLAFATPAALAYALGAGLLLWRRERIVPALGAVLQLLVIGIYFRLATDRVPAFEIWGLSIRVAQVLLLGVLATLALGGRRPAGERPRR